MLALMLAGMFCESFFHLPVPVPSVEHLAYFVTISWKQGVPQLTNERHSHDEVCYALLFG